MITITESAGRLLVRITGPSPVAAILRISLRERFPSHYRCYSDRELAFPFPLYRRRDLERWCDLRCSEGVAVRWEGRA